MPRRYSMTQRAGLTAATRARVLDAVLDLILERGPEAVTMQAVAARADLAPRTIYNHFTSRDDLLAAAWADLASEVAGAAVHIADAAALSPREALACFVRVTYGQLQAQSRRLTAILAIRGYRQLDEAVARVRQQRRDRLQALLEPAARSGTLRVPLDEAVAFAYVLTAHATRENLVEQLGLPIDDAIRVVTRHLDGALFGAPDGRNGDEPDAADLGLRYTLCAPDGEADRSRNGHGNPKPAGERGG